MTLWTFIFAVVVLGIAAGVVTEWMKLKYRAGGRSADEPDARKMQDIRAENEQLRSEVAELNERLTVLERIATDPAERVSREIEKLRNE
jgi:uncharacterized protein YlxW (UPF0749 family)